MSRSEKNLKIIRIIINNHITFNNTFFFLQWEKFSSLASHLPLVIVVIGLRPIDKSRRFGTLRKASDGIREKLLSCRRRRLKVVSPRRDVASSFLRRHEEMSKYVSDLKDENESDAIVPTNGFPDKYSSAKFERC